MTTNVPESNPNSTEQQIPKVEQSNTTPETLSDLSAQIDGQKGAIATMVESLVSGDQQLAAKTAADPSTDRAAVKELTTGLNSLDTQAQEVALNGERQLDAVRDGQNPVVTPDAGAGEAVVDASGSVEPNQEADTFDIQAMQKAESIRFGDIEEAAKFVRMIDSDREYISRGQVERYFNSDLFNDIMAGLRSYAKKSQELQSVLNSKMVQGLTTEVSKQDQTVSELRAGMTSDLLRAQSNIELSINFIRAVASKVKEMLDNRFDSHIEMEYETLRKLGRGLTRLNEQIETSLNAEKVPESTGPVSEPVEDPDIATTASEATDSKSDEVTDVGEKTDETDSGEDEEVVSTEGQPVAVPPIPQASEPTTINDQPSPQGTQEAAVSAAPESTDTGFNLEESQKKVNELLSNLDTRPFKRRMQEDLGLEMPERADTEVEWYRLYSDIGKGLEDRGIPEDKVWNTARLMLENNGYPMPDPPRLKDSGEGDGSQDDETDFSDEEMSEWSDEVGEMDGDDLEEYETIMAVKEQEQALEGVDKSATPAPSRNEQLQSFRQKMKEKHPKEPEERKTSISSAELQTRIDFIKGNNSFRPDSISAKMIKTADGALKEIERFFPKRGEKESFLLGTMNQILGSKDLYQKLDNAQDFAANMRERFSGDQLVAQGLFGPKMEKQIWLLFRLLDPNTKLNSPSDAEGNKTISDVGAVEMPQSPVETSDTQANKPPEATTEPGVADMGAGEDDFVEEAQSSNTERRSRIAEYERDHGALMDRARNMGVKEPDVQDKLTPADVAQFGHIAERDYSRYQRAVDAAASALKKPEAGQTSV